MAALLLAMATRGAAAPRQDHGKPAPTQAKAQPSPPATRSDAAKSDQAKSDQAKSAPVKLGLLINEPKALQGYTLISPFNSTRTFLLDMQGRVVHSWEAGCAPALSAFLLDNGHLVRPGSIGDDASVFGPGPGVGGRIQEFTWDGDVVWNFRFYNPKQLPHHDMTRLPNGNVLLVVWDRKTAEEAIAAGRRPEMTGDRHFMPDSLIEIKPTGKTTGEVVWEWHLWDHLIQDADSTKANYGDVAAHPELVDINFWEDENISVTAAWQGAPPAQKADGRPTAKADGKPAARADSKPRIDPDFTHFNGISYNPELDQIAMSVWSFSEVWIIDHGTTTAQAAGHTGGRRGRGGDLLYRYGNPVAYRAGTRADRKLFNQHNTHWIPAGLPGAGHLMLFNNGGKRPDGPYSTVDELVLPVDAQGHYTRQPGKPFGPDAPVWRYSAPRKSDFFSSFISGAQRLPNGNTLICSGANGTIFEVTSDKTIVWKYINPFKGDTPIGPRRRPGQILPRIAGELLGITADQRKQVDEIQGDIDAHLDRLLTADQKKQAAATQGRGGGGGPGPGHRPGEVLSVPEQDRLKLTDDQKKDVLVLQRSVDGRFERLLTAAQRHQIKTVFAPHGPPPGGPGSGPGDSPQPGKLFSATQQDALKLSAEQKSRLEAMQKEIDARFETLLTEDQKKQLQAMRQQRPPGPGGPGPNGPPGGPPLFRAYRYANSFRGFAGKALKPGKPLEDWKPEEPEKPHR
ncbi:MAG: aryl-sulfate sulfotransferase [Isosphaeraceae bacterium]